MARHQEHNFEGRRRQDRAMDERRGAWGREEHERRSTMEDRRYEDEPWASREWSSGQGDLGQGGYWQSEGTHRGGWGRGEMGAGPWGHGEREFGQGSYGDPREREFGRDRGARGWMERQRPGMQEWEHPGPYAGRGPKGYQRSDERIKEDLCERLTQHGEIDASEIEVKVSNREITLTGAVPSRQAKRMAEDLAEAVSGITDVHNQLRVSQDRSEEHTS